MQKWYFKLLDQDLNQAGFKVGVVDEEHDYTYDPNGNVATVGRDGGLLTYSYDPMDRVTQMVKTVAIPGVTRPHQIDWTYAATGNLTQRKETADDSSITTYDSTYDSADRLTQIVTTPGSTVTYTNDANGNMTGDSAGRSFTWNTLDQLTQVTSGGVTSTFAYDPLGRRTNFNSKTYLNDGPTVLTDGSSSFLNGANIDEPLHLLNGSITNDYLADNLGSATQLTDNTGLVYRSNDLICKKTYFSTLNGMMQK